MAAGGEADDADFVGVDIPVGGVGADGADGAAEVLEGGGVAVARGDAVFEDEGGDAAGREPPGDLMALVGHDDGAVAAAGTDDDGGG